MDAFVGEIRLFSWGFVPRGWLPCSGGLLAISSYPTLFSLLGVQYGGDGRTTFGLPNLNGRTIVGSGTGASGTPYANGQSDGVETVALSLDQMPAHNHSVFGADIAGSAATPAGNVFANTPDQNAYGTQPPLLAQGPATVGSAGGGQPHANMQPSLVLNYCIALNGTFPSHQ